MGKIFLVLVCLVSWYGGVFAADTDPIAQTKMLLDQYSQKVKMLENENAILREEMRKANIKIPLSVFSGAIAQTGAMTTPSQVVVSSGTQTGVISSTIPSDASFSEVEKIYGASYAGFMRKVSSDWDKIRDAYLMPQGATVSGYEFVNSGAQDHVFVDITYSGSVLPVGIFDAKILYQFDKTTFARKLIGLFEYNKATGFYTTKSGKNIFPGVKRTWVPHPGNTGSTSSNASSSTTSGTSVPSVTTPVLYTDIEAAYTAKRYLSVISLSNTWLTANQPTLDVLRIRYRTYFIIAKYNEALAEIARIQSLGQMSSAVACEGYVIATYAKNTSLADQYKATCNKK